MSKQQGILAELLPLLGERLRTHRRQKGLTQEKAAEFLGITAKHMSELERGITPPSLELLCRLAVRYDSTPSHLLEIGEGKTKALREINTLLETADEKTLNTIFKICAVLIG